MSHVDCVLIRGCEAPEEVRPTLQKHGLTVGPEPHEKQKVEQVLLDALEDGHLRGVPGHVVKVLRDEYVEIPPAWAAEAPEELLKMLGPVLAKTC